MARAGGADPSPGGAEDGGECADGLQNGSQYHPRQSGYLNAIRVSLWNKAPTNFTLLTPSVAIHLPAQINDRPHGPGRVSEAPPDKTTAHRATAPGNNEWVRSAALTPALSHRERGKTEPHSGPSYTGRGRNRQFQSRKWVNHQQVARTPGRARREPPPGIKAAPCPLPLPGGAALARAYGER